MRENKKKRYEYKLNLGRTWNGQIIRKSFYSTKSKADARRKAEKYRAQYELKLLCGSDMEKSMHTAVASGRWCGDQWPQCGLVASPDIAY